MCYRRLAEITGEYVRKGGKVYIEGSLRTQQWEKNGEKRYTTEIIAKAELREIVCAHGGEPITLAGLTLRFFPYDAKAIACETRLSSLGFSEVRDGKQIQLRGVWLRTSSMSRNARPEWRAWRAQGLNASEVAILWAFALQVHLETLG